MDTHAAICELWENDRAMATDVGASPFVTQKWRLRDSIPGEWWQAVVDAAGRRGFSAVTLDQLAAIASKKRSVA